MTHDAEAETSAPTINISLQTLAPSMQYCTKTVTDNAHRSWPKYSNDTTVMTDTNGQYSSFVKYWYNLTKQIGKQCVSIWHHMICRTTAGRMPHLLGLLRTLTKNAITDVTWLQRTANPERISLVSVLSRKKISLAIFIQWCATAHDVNYPFFKKADLGHTGVNG